MNRALLAAALLLLAASRPAGATYLALDAAESVAGLGFYNVVSMHEMTGGRWGVEVAPGLFQTDAGGSQDTPFTAKGTVGAISIKREFSPHFGVGLIAAFASQGSDATMGGSGVNEFAPTAAAALPGGVVKGMKSTVAGAFGTFDPFSDPEGFRLPITLGLLYQTDSVQFENTTGSRTDTVDLSNGKIPSSWIGLLNISTDFIFFKKLRVMPGFMFAENPKYEPDLGGHVPSIDYDYVVNNGGSVTRYAANRPLNANFGAIYVSLLWRPWNLGFDTILIPSETKVYSLHWTHKFGS